MFRLFGLLLVGLVLSGIAGSQTAWADTISCKRTSNSSAGFTTSSAFDSWFPKQLSLNTYDWAKIKGQKSVKKKDGQRIYQLLPNGKMIASMEHQSGYQTVSNIRYKCDKTAIQITSGDSEISPNNSDDTIKELYATKGGCNSQSTDCLNISDFEIVLSRQLAGSEKQLFFFVSKLNRFECPTGYSIYEPANMIAGGTKVSVCGTRNAKLKTQH